MLYGTSYYPEYQPVERLDEDVRMMVDASLNYARLGDAIWALCEPVEGRFELDWLQRVLDAMCANGVHVVLCTPTYTIPPWLHRRHPEVMARFGGGVRAHYGGRQSFDFSHPAYRFHAERIVRALLERYAAHPAVIGFQVDNETGSQLVENDEVFDAFVEHLKEKFGSVEALNEVWGLNYWSHRLGSWVDLWRPGAQFAIGTGTSGNTNPGYDLEWRRFHATVTTDFLAWLAGIVREYAAPHQFVTHDMVGGHGRGDADRFGIGAVIDVAAENLPHATQDALAFPPVSAAPAGGINSLRDGMGPAGLYLKADLGYGGRRSNFLVTEINPVSVGGSANIFPEYDGQWRLEAYAAIARGANAVAYWHWHSLHYGREIYSHGVLNHDLKPNRCYDEIARIGSELAEHGELLTDLEPEADIGFLYSYDSRYALEFQPCLRSEVTGQGDAGSYERIFDRLYRGFFAARAQAGVYGPDQTFEEMPVLVVPALYVADTALLDRLTTYARDGGHLVLTFRSGYADEYGRARWQRAPGPLRAAVGAGYNMYSHLSAPLRLRDTASGLELSDGAAVEGWADELQLEGAQPLAYYDHPHFGRFPAAVTHPVEAGRVTYLGTLPNEVAAQDIASWVLRQSGIEPPGVGLPESVRLTRARSAAGERLWFLSNWSFEDRSVAAPAAGRDLFTGTTWDTEDELALGPWDVTVLRES